MSDRVSSSTEGRGGLAALPSTGLRDVVAAVRFESAHVRASIHRLRGVTTCDLELSVSGAGLGTLRVTGHCLCRDFVVDMLVEADRFLVRRAGAGLRNPPGAVRSHVRKRAGEWTRRRRADQGAQARTDRLRGSVIGRSLPDDYHRALLEYVASEAGSLAPFVDDEAFHRRLAALAAAEFGGTTEDHLAQVRACLPAVEAACCAARRVPARDGGAPVTWWQHYVVEPLGRRDRFDNESLDRVDPDGRTLAQRVGHTVVASSRDDDVVDVVLARTKGGASAGRLDAAMAELVRRQLITPAAARAFIDDPGRVREAAEQVRALAAV